MTPPKTSISAPPRGRSTILALALAAASFVAAKAGLVVASSVDAVAVLAPASGVAFAALALFGLRFAPALLVGTFAAIYSSLGDPWTSLVVAFAGTAGAATGVWLARQSGAFDTALERVPDVLKLLAAGAVGGAAVAATIITATMAGGGLAWPLAPSPSWLDWWAGDALGVMLFAPALVTWGARPRPDRHVVEGIALAGLLLVAFLVADQVPYARPAGLPAVLLAAFVIVPVAIVASIRLAPREVATANALLAGAIAISTLAGFGPLAAQTQDGAHVVLLGFLSMLALASLVVSAASAEQRRAVRERGESEERFRSLTELAHDWYWEQDASYRFTVLSSGFFSGTGLAESECLGRTRREIVPDALDEAGWAEHQRLLDAREPFHDLLLKVKTADGGVRQFVSSGEPVFDGRGRFAGYRGVARDVTEDRRAEEAIRASQIRFERLFRASPQPLAMSSIEDGTVLDVNDAWTRAYGYERGAIIGKNLVDLGLWADLRVRERLRERLMREGAVRDVECAWHRASGDLAEVLLSVQVVRLADEDVMLSTAIDITRRKRAERMLAESEARFSKIFESSPVPVVISRLADGRHIQVNDAWMRFFGFSRDEVVGRSAAELGVWAEPADRDGFRRQLVERGSVTDWEARLRKHSGEVIDALLSAEVVDLEGDRCLITSLVDITERKRAERQLQESERRFRDVAEAAGEYVWEMDASRRYTYLSRRVEAVLGYRPEELYGRQPFEFMPSEEANRVRDLFDEAYRHGLPFRNLEYRSLTRSGTQVWQVVSAIPIVGANGRVAGFRGTALDVTERKQADARIEELATRDPLTGLPNRTLLNDRLTQGLAAAARTETLLAVMFVDLDHFKEVNDTLGHEVGDLLLKEVARRIGSALRKEDTLSRLGGDEFVIVLERLRSADGAGQVAQKILNALSPPCELAGHSVSTGASLGIAVYPADGTDAATLMRHADTAMYAAKSGGRKGYRFFSADMNLRATERLRTESGLRRALDRGELRLLYQPRVEIATGRITGAEALLRWRHPKLGLIGPDRFMKAAEETGLIHPIGEWVLRTVCEQAAAWATSGKVRIPVAVNVSSRQFAPELVDRVSDALDRAALDAALLELEVAESTLMRDVEASRVILERLAAIGIRTLVDDFGTGYSAMQYLRRLPVHGVKIDRSFVAALGESSDDRVVVNAIVEMAQGLGLEVIAEGIENEGQLAILAEIGCHECLGHHFSPPVPAPEIERRLLAESNVATLTSRRGN